MKESKELNVFDTPNEFHFPFDPYPIQQDFMKELYATLEASSVGIFESPTGTVSIDYSTVI